MAEIIAAFQSLKTAKEIAQTILRMKIDAEVNLKVSEIIDLLLAAQERNLTAQEDHAAMSRRVDELEKQLLKFEQWAEEKQRYVLQEVESGNLIYACKETEQGGEPPHNICPNCYEDRVKSILQVDWPISGVAGGKWLKCPRCDFAILP